MSMTKEQEAIEYFDGKILEEGDNITITIDFIENLETVLNMLKKMKTQEENYKNLIVDVSGIAKELGLEEDGTIDEIYAKIRKKDKELEKKDNIIDLMSEQLAGLTIWNNEKEEPVILGDKEEVKQYFERKSK